MYDVVVIGGNLAGIHAAINAVKKGVTVALVEKNKQPYKPAHCGEGLLEIAGDLLGLFEFKCLKNKINKIIVNVATNEEFIFNMKKFNLVIFDRNCVENALIRKVKKLGVKHFFGRTMKDFQPPHKVLLDKNETIYGKVIIDASGIACEVGRKVGLKTKIKKEDIGVCIQSRVIGKFDSNSVRVWFHKPYAPWGYAWLFPVTEKTANIGLGIRGGQKLYLDVLLKKFIKDIVKDTYKITSTFKDCVPISKPLDPLFKDNVIVTGDAARLADSIGAAGIRNAVLSGILAGKIAANYVNGDISSFEIYQEKMSRITNSLKKTYYRSSKIFGDEEKFLKKYTRAIKYLRNLDRIAPAFLEKRIAKAFVKDINVIQSYN
jgi:digeranylgeranylglycerophospholipid reductase